MTRIIVAILLIVIVNPSVAHSGRTNSEGCHNNRKTGGYHCHGSSTPKKSTYSTPKADTSEGFTIIPTGLGSDYFVVIAGWNFCRSCRSCW